MQRSSPVCPPPPTPSSLKCSTRIGKLIFLEASNPFHRPIAKDPAPHSTDLDVDWGPRAPGTAHCLREEPEKAVALRVSANLYPFLNSGQQLSRAAVGSAGGEESSFSQMPEHPSASTSLRLQEISGFRQRQGARVRNSEYWSLLRPAVV